MHLAVEICYILSRPPVGPASLWSLTSSLLTHHRVRDSLSHLTHVTVKASAAGTAAQATIPTSVTTIPGTLENSQAGQAGLRELQATLLTLCLKREQLGREPPDVPAVGEALSL